MASERVVKVTLTAQMQNYVEGMEKAAKATRETGSEAEKLAQTKQSFEALGRAGVTMGAVLAAGLGVAVARFADFDAAMSSVKATGDDAASSIDALREAAIEAGASTVFSATESANAIEELAKAGVSAADILGGGLAGSLDLAAAGGLGVADAAGIAATALKTFNLEGEDVPRVADLLAAGAGKAMGDVQDLSAALNQSAQVAAATGLSIDETTAALSAFASQGLLGSDAGTSFKTMLQSLTPQSAKAKAEMDRLGISAYDASGQFVGLEKFAGNLQSSMKNLTPEARNAAMSVIFGSDAVRAANVLYKEGASGIRDWTDAVDDQGYAARTAATKLDNLKGDIEALQGAIDSAFIETGAEANSSLRTLVQTVTGLVDMYNDLPEPVKGATMAIGGATAAIALTGGTALLAVPKWVAFQDAVKGTSFSMKTAGLTAGAAGLALGGLFAIVSGLATEHAAATARVDSYAAALRAGTKSTEEYVAQQLALNDTHLFLDIGNAIDNAEKLGITTDEVTAALKASESEYKAFVTRVRLLGGEFGDSARAAVQLTDKTDQLRSEQVAAEKQIDAVNKATASLTGSSDDNAASVATAAEAYLDAAGGAQELTSQLDELIGKINEANGVGQDAVSANIDYQDALRKVDEQIRNVQGGVEGFAAGLDITTEAGSANKQMLVDLAKDAQGAAKAQFDLDGNTESYRATLESSRQALIDRATQLGANADEAEALADQIFRIPSDTEWSMIAETREAQDKLNTILGTIRTITAFNGTKLRLDVDSDSFQIPQGRATGGPIFGPGTRTSDSIPIMASNGEHMLSAAEVDGLGGHSMVAALRASARAGTYANQEHWVPAGANTVYGFTSGSIAAATASQSMPDTVTLVDMDGAILARARVIADEAAARHGRNTVRAIQNGLR